MAWAYWLAAPLVATLLGAGWLWLRARPPRPLDTLQSIAGHRAYLDALESVVAAAPAAPAAPTPDAVTRRVSPRLARYESSSPNAVAGPA
jgi:hypothetical protein